MSASADYGSMINATFESSVTDIFNQSFPLVGPDGQPYWFDTTLFIDFSHLSASSAIIYSVQMGMAGLLFLLVLIMTRPDKRTSAIFVLNASALLFAFFRNLLGALQLQTQFYNFVAVQFAYYPDTEALRQAQAVAIAAEVFNVLLDICIYASLVLQVHVICCTMVKNFKKVITALAGVVAIGACVTRVVLAVYNSKYRIIRVNDLNHGVDITINRVASANNIVSISSIVFFTIVFNAKLAVAILARRKMNMKAFGPMQIIFIMGCQTMIIPLIFAILTYYVAVGRQLQSFVVTIVAVFLPLSGMWATANTTHNRIAEENARQRAFPVGASSWGNSNRGAVATSETMETLVGPDVELGFTHNNKGTTSVNHQPESSLGRSNNMDNKGVFVDRTYSIRTD